MIAIIDYGRGNLFSLGQALRVLDQDHVVTSDAAQILAADKVILPGVGAFGDAMANLTASGLVPVIHEVAARGTTLLGICLGLQMLGDSSEEFGHHRGLGLVPGQVVRLPDGEVRIPNVGWRLLRACNGDATFSALPADAMAYFVHSFHLRPENPAHLAAAIRINGIDVTAAVRRGNVMGCQFHPEKSGPIGLGILAEMLGLNTADETQAAS